MINRVERQNEMGQQRAVEDRGAQRISPQRQKPFTAGFHGTERNQSERMIEQMGGEIGEQHQTRDDPRAPNVHEVAPIYYEAGVPSTRRKPGCLAPR